MARLGRIDNSQAEDCGILKRLADGEIYDLCRKHLRLRGKLINGF